jgi:hypothetical protein
MIDGPIWVIIALGLLAGAIWVIFISWLLLQIFKTVINDIIMRKLW